MRLLLLAGVAGAVGSTSLAPPLGRPVRPAPPLKLTLRVVAPEPELRAGRVERVEVRREYALILRPEQVRQVREGRSVAPLKTALESVYKQIDARQPLNAVFRDEDGGWTARGQTGWTVRRAESERALLAALLERRETVDLPVGLTAPAQSVRTLLEQGVVAHRAAGESSFTGSPSFRVHNIRVGGEKLHGHLLEPDEVFDFNRMVGTISAAQGFVPGYVIAGDTLNMEDGGGICQVSTTVFRAAYQAGLPIVERHAHSHSVAYYDPPGFEATVYAPALNLRFRNDTGVPLLMQVSWDLKRETLRVDLFGAPPDRQVSVSAPVVRDRRLAPPPRFLAAPDLQPSETKRVDMPASGMRVTITRQVRMNSGPTRTDYTRSTYRPWGGVFAVHPEDERLE
ncbi:VanW family protein [Deinococcus sp. YIM 134068]|uniref:VanW family protein n=1 Tax=Deinococcus lichenicola TaxID=3118910 RepID=UPI002F92E163